MRDWNGRGNESIAVSGAVINGEVRASAGNDALSWLNGDQIRSALMMSDGEETASFSGLNETLLGTTPSIDCGLGNGQLTFDDIFHLHSTCTTNSESAVSIISPILKL